MGRGEYGPHIARIIDGAPLSPALYGLLERDLKKAIHRRRIYRFPAFIGCPEIHDWSEPGALASLATDFLAESIVPRLGSIQTKLEAHGDIDELVRGNIARFVHDRQRTADPVGTALYRNLLIALRVLATTAGVIMSEVDPREATFRATAARAEPGADLGVALRGTRDWTTRAKALSARSKPEAQALAPVLHDLLKRGHGFSLGDLLEILRPEVRGAWRAVWSEGAEESLPRDPDELARLVPLVGREIEALPVQGRTRRGVRAVFDAYVAAVRAGEDPMPTQVEIAARIGMAKGTVFEHVLRLRALLERLDDDPPEVNHE